MDIYMCPDCGYEYNPLYGDPGSGIPAGIPFEDLPEEWVCPLCAVPKSVFILKG